MVKNRRLFTAGKRLRALRELMGLSRPQFAELVGMTAKRLENIENELQRMHDEDFEKVCGTFPEFSDWIAYEGSIEPQSIAWKVADSAQAAAVYLVERNPVLLEQHGIDMQAWRERHREIREALLAAEQAPEAEPAEAVGVRSGASLPGCGRRTPKRGCSSGREPKAVGPGASCRARRRSWERRSAPAPRARLPGTSARAWLAS